VVGDSPEICRALDSHGFADLKLSMAYHISLTSVYDNDDNRRFKTGTPTEVWHTMTRCWEMEPTSDRIVNDIQKFPEVLRKIIAFHGCVVHDEFLRSGRRERSKDEKRILKHKSRISQRKDTMLMQPTHEDALDARNMIGNGSLMINVEIKNTSSYSIQEKENKIELSSTMDEDLYMALPYNSIVEC